MPRIIILVAVTLLASPVLAARDVPVTSSGRSGQRLVYESVTPPRDPSREERERPTE